MVRDLDEMRAFKNSEAMLVKNINEGDAIEQVIYESSLRQLRQAHAKYVRGDAVIQLVIEDEVFDYASLNFEAEKNRDS